MFFEALACGIPVICSETDFFVEQLDKLGCQELVFRPYTPEALASKICHVASTYPKYRRVFVEQRWSRFPGQNGGLAKVVSGFDYAASFSCSLSIA